MTAGQSNTPEQAPFLKKGPTPYQEFLAEREEILRYKWLESERLGRDIGFDRALMDWIRFHRRNWIKGRESESAGNKEGAARQ